MMRMRNVAANNLSLVHPLQRHSSDSISVYRFELSFQHNSYVDLTQSRYLSVHPLPTLHDSTDSRGSTDSVVDSMFDLCPRRFVAIFSDSPQLRLDVPLIILTRAHELSTIYDEIHLMKESNSNRLEGDLPGTVNMAEGERQRE